MGISIFILGIPILVAVLIFRLKKWSIIKKIIITLILIIVYGALLVYLFVQGFDRGLERRIINETEIMNNE